MKSVLIGAAFALLCLPASAMEMVDPAKAGIDTNKLETAKTEIIKDISDGKLAGATLTVFRNGVIGYDEAFGTRGNGASEGPLKTDDIFRIYSMSKPITTTAAMILMERGKLKLEDPLSKYVPSFANSQVLADGKRVPQERPITIADLMRHTSGIVYGFFGDTPARAEYRNANLYDPNQTNAELADKLAMLPLEHQPGSAWEYSHSTDVLARVVEVASGQSIGDFVKTNILDPLGMKDTSFYVEAAKKDRVVEPQYPGLLNPLQKPTYQSGGGGMMSTAPDYVTFLRMILNNGSLNGTQILKPETVQLMTSDQLGDIKPGNYNLLGPVYGFGYGFAVRRSDEGPFPGSKGDLYWGGYAGTYFWIDPSENLITVFMMQAPKLRAGYRPRIRSWVYNALK
ncbi:serine hydrolase domain-containing protein [Sneathiella limimaris]|uniref:serine hydrolase domain-containing protein n=1 Tax=Sneathiella limimaris TaxID=1964213 RepID=UPI00146A5D94|nr:serine hydrolase domain-containing protein [Sneathiella limimaris]